MLGARVLITAVFSLCAGPVLAHPGHAEAGFLSGMMHPIGGLDHLLAMLAVGLYAAGQARSARWVLPGAFVSAMLAGALLGTSGVALPFVEQGIAASVLVLGLLIASLARVRLAWTLPVVVLFAVFHGYAHQTEMGEAGLLHYAAGFALATAGLHLAGFLSARWLPESRTGDALKRIVGVAVAGVGVLMLAR